MATDPQKSTTPNAEASSIAGQAPDASPSAREKRARAIQIAIAAAFLIGFALLSHYGNSSDSPRLGAALSVGPILLIGAVLLWRWTHPAVAVAVAIVVGALLYHFWGALERNYEWADLIQQAGAFALIAWSFGRTLRAGRVPLCTELFVKMHGAPNPGELRYTRNATIAWTLFYLVLTIIIVGLYFAAPLKVWSAFVNFGTFALIALMAAADHALRRRVLPPRLGGGLLTALRQSLIG